MPFTLRSLCSLAAIVLLAVGSGSAAENPQARMDEKHREFLKTNCVACHNAEKQSGEVRLDHIAFTLDTVARADLWQKVLNAVNSGEMPPEDAKQPDREAKTEFLEALSETLVVARKSLGDVRGKITMRRLNRREYKNTIRDLLGVDIGVKELPADGGAGTFDTVGSSLFMSSDQFEQYLSLGRQALDEHFARHSPTQPTRKLHVECEERNARIEKSLAKRQDDRDRYMKWTAAVEAAAAKPENAEVAAKIRAEKKNDATHLYFQWQRLTGAPAPKEFGFVDAVNADEAGRRDWVHYVPHHRAYLEQPGIKTGSYLTIDDVFVNPYQPFRLPGDWPPGDYVVRVRLAATDAAPRERRFVEFGAQHDSGVRAVMSSHQVTGTMAEPQVLEIPLKFSPNKGRGFFLQEKGSYESDGAANRLFAEAWQRNGVGPEFALWLDWIEVSSATATNTPTAPAKVEKLRKDPEQWANKYMPIYAQGYAEKFGRFQKWCDAIDEAAKKPENADIVKKLRDEPKVKQSPHLFYSRFAEIKDAPPPTQFGFKDVDEAQFARSEYVYHFRYYDDYQKLPARDAGSWLMLYSLGRYTGITAPDKWPAGKYTLRVRLAASDESPQERRFIEIGTGKADAADFNVLSSHQVTGTLASPQTLEIPVEINASGDRNFAIRDKRPNNREAEYAMFREAWDKTGTGPRPCIWIDYVELEGPVSAGTSLSPALAHTIKQHIEPEVPPVLFANTTGASERDHARAILTAFAERAFRGKRPSATYLDKLVALYEARRKAGASFDAALKEPLSVVLASPGFLYLAEPTSFVPAVPLVPSKGHGTNATNGTNESHRLTQQEIAVRLSYFLWSAPPDDELLALARNGELSKPEVLTREVDRLIASPKSDEFVSGFVHQWLDMERLDFFQFDTKLHRDFDESARAASRREVYETFAYLLRNEGSVSRLLKSDEVFVNGLLANYYGLEGVSGDEFRKVTLPPDSPRGGLLGMAAILAMGSNGQVSSPVERGAWVMRKLLHDPPPPAPKNVPQLSRLEGKLLTARERIIAHQEQPQCAQCHRKIDPIGFGLENFNAAGKWRTEDSYEKRGVGKKTWPIDPSGTFHKGPAFKDYFELRDIIASKPEAFSRGLTEALIEYALGRPYGFTDEALATTVVQQASENNFALREFIIALVTSREFQHK